MDQLRLRPTRLQEVAVSDVIAKWTDEFENASFVFIGEFIADQIPLVIRGFYKKPNLIGSAFSIAGLDCLEITAHYRDGTRETWSNVPIHDGVVPPWKTFHQMTSVGFDEIWNRAKTNKSKKAKATIEGSKFAESCEESFAKESEWRKSMQDAAPTKAKDTDRSHNEAENKVWEFVREYSNSPWFHQNEPLKTKSGSEILSASLEFQIEIVRACFRLSEKIVDETGYEADRDVRERLLRRALPYNADDVEFLAARLMESARDEFAGGPDKFILGAIEHYAKERELSKKTKDMLRVARDIAQESYFARSLSQVKTRIDALVGDEESRNPIKPREAWADAAIDDIKSMPADQRRNWIKLLQHCTKATSSKPSAAWKKQTESLLNELPPKHFHDSVYRWFSLLNRPRSGPPVGFDRNDPLSIADPNQDILRGVLWCCSLHSDHHTARRIGPVAFSAYKKIRGVGPRAVKVGNAAVYALSQLASTEAVGQLAMLKVRVKFGSAQKEIEKAFNAAAEALNIPRDDIEEMGVPSYGLEEGGVLRETLGDYTAEIVVTGSDAKLNWSDAKGKQLKSVPAKVKSEHKDEYKELQQSLKDIQGMLPAQRDRIDSMFLLQKTWPIDVWRERYLQHPLVGTIAKRLLWCVDGTPALFIDGEATDVIGKKIKHGKTAEIMLWHPVGRTIDEITGWRHRLEELTITQPFKQAHREVYLLTDAERNTATYSNRYAAHVIRQHQFNALCQARGWKNQLRLMVDQSYEPAHKNLPLWNLRAEFWIEGIGDNYGTDTNDAGTFLRLATDQVRFYQIEAAPNYVHAGGGGYGRYNVGPGTNNVNEPLPLEQIPPLVFSEIMRDVDLFVGVASVGNDPTWQDGGPQGRYRDYWHTYSFGELSGSATTRKQVLERLVPRLNIADRCSLSDRFLVVRGNKRTYKIHLGSGNILMEPNDQYLCIVPDSRARAKEDDLYLPFEGDGVLSIIISKALLLAADDKIKDPTITRQIG